MLMASLRTVPVPWLDPSRGRLRTGSGCDGEACLERIPVACMGRGDGGGTTADPNGRSADPWLGSLRIGLGQRHPAAVARRQAVVAHGDEGGVDDLEQMHPRLPAAGEALQPLLGVGGELDLRLLERGSREAPDLTQRRIEDPGVGDERQAAGQIDAMRQERPVDPHGSAQVHHGPFALGSGRAGDERSTRAFDGDRPHPPLPFSRRAPAIWFTQAAAGIGHPGSRGPARSVSARQAPLLTLGVIVLLVAFIAAIEPALAQADPFRGLVTKANTLQTDLADLGKAVGFICGVGCIIMGFVKRGQWPFGWMIAIACGFFGLGALSAIASFASS